MKDKVVEQFTSGFPEAFYDWVAYIMPATFFAVGLGCHLQSQWCAIAEMPESILGASGGWVRDLVVALLVLGGLYLLGQLLTSISNLVLLPACRTLRRRLTRAPKAARAPGKPPPWYEDYVEVKTRHPSMSPLITKAYARHVAARNIALANLVLLLVGLVLAHWGWAIVHFALLLLFFYDTYTRKYWFEQYAQTIKGVQDGKGAVP